MQNPLFESIQPVLIIAIALSAIAPERAQACSADQVRHATYHSQRNLHRLVIMHKAGDAEVDAQATHLQTWLQTQAVGINISFEKVDVDQSDIDWQGDYGVPSAPPETPVTVLVGEDKVAYRSFIIDVWEPFPTDEDLEVLRSSPVREVVRPNVVTKWGVLLYSPGAGPKADQCMPVLDTVQKTWAEKAPPGIAVVRLDRNDPQERLTTSFIGLNPDGPDWVGLCFGRGKIMLPPLEGDAITEENLNELIQNLMESCGCLRRPENLGIDIPMTWDSSLDQIYVALDGPDLTEEIQQAREQELAAIMPEAERPRYLATAGLTLGAVAILAASITGIGLMVRQRRNSLPLE